MIFCLWGQTGGGHMNKKMFMQGGRVERKEAFLYCTGIYGQNLACALMMNWFMNFCTDVLYAIHNIPLYEKRPTYEAFLIKMGRMMGFEPTHKGTTILGLNRLTTSAISLLIHSNTNKILIKKKFKRNKF